MIRFRTIEPETAATPAAKPSAPVAPAITAPDVLEVAAKLPAGGKSLARKSQLRAKKPAAAGLFRDEAD